MILRVSGAVNNQDHRAVFAKVVKDPNFKKGSKVLLFDSGGRYAPTLTEAADLVTMVKEHQKTYFGRFAVVVSNLFHWSVGRMVAAYASLAGAELRVFRGEEVARKWLFAEDDSTKRTDA